MANWPTINGTSLSGTASSPPSTRRRRWVSQRAQPILLRATALDLARGVAAGLRGVQAGGCAKASRHVGQHQFEKSRRSFSRQDTPSCGTQAPIPPSPASMSSPSIAEPPARRKGPSTGIRRIDQRWARQLEFVDPCDSQPQSGHKGPSSVESAV
jgi:hypothetical protein